MMIDFILNKAIDEQIDKFLGFGYTTYGFSREEMEDNFS